MANLDQFIASNSRNEWIVEPGLTYYVRKSLFFPGLIELANCNASRNSKALGYWRFLKRYEQRVPFIAEQVINDALAALYRRRKWQERDIGGTPQFASPLAVERYRGDDYFDRFYPPLG